MESVLSFTFMWAPEMELVRLASFSNQCLYIMSFPIGQGQLHFAYLKKKKTLKVDTSGPYPIDHWRITQLCETFHRLRSGQWPKLPELASLGLQC